MKGISSIISFVIVVVLVMSIAAMIVPWALNIARDATQSVENSTTMELMCQNAAYDFDTDYGIYGVSYNLSKSFPENDTIWVKITNTGTINVYNFSIEVEINTSEYIDIRELQINSSSQKTKSNPLKPGSSVILRAAIEEDYHNPLESVKVLNIVCPNVYVEQDI